MYIKQKFNALKRYIMAGSMLAAMLALVLGSFSVSQAQVANEPIISNQNVVSTTDGTGATITWTTDENATSQVAYGTTSTPYSTFSAMDMTDVMSHSLTLSDLMPDTTYHYQVISMDAGSSTSYSTDATFVTPAVTSTSTDTGTGTGTTTDTTGTDISALQAAVAALQQEVATLQQQVANLMNNQSTGTSTGTGSTTPPIVNTGMISPSNSSVNMGGSVDFTGSGFGHEESVLIMTNDVVVATAHADGGGNFSTGSMSVPTGAGTWTYTFRGVNSGIMGTATVTTQ